MRLVYFWFLLFLFNSCVDQLSLPAFEASENIVVDGLISDGPGPYRVKIFYASRLDEFLGTPQPVTNAAVSISDDLGNSYLLTEISPGVYWSQVDELCGEAGRQYALRIFAPSGKEYRTNPQMLNPAGEVKEIYYSFAPNVLNGGEPEKPQNAMEVFMDASGVNGSENLFRWRWSGTYQVRAHPELQTRAVGLSNVPDPPPCSGYIVAGGQIVKVGPCTCCDCWATEYSEAGLISNNRYIQDKEFNKVNIARLPVNQWRFYVRYYIEVEQMSVSQEVHAFWKLVRDQADGVGSLFQPNAIKIRGNVFCVSDPDEEVFGVFAVSGITRKSQFIDRFDVPYDQPPVDTVPYDCRVAFKNVSIEKPPFW